MNPFAIEFTWLARDCGDPIARATLAEITIEADGHSATELEDLLSRTVRRGVRASAYTLALWFASNWWRLRWEPRSNSADWAMSHCIGAAGEGYLWPDVSFIGDGGMVQVQSVSSPILSGAVRYLNRFIVPVRAMDFEVGVDKFVNAVLDRLNTMDADAGELASIWKEVLNERRDPSLAGWRRIEALMGFDPDGAPERLVEDLLQIGATHGIRAVEEVAAASGDQALAHLKELCNGSRQAAKPVHVPQFEALRERISQLPEKLLPWQRAEKAAHMARECWSLGGGPIPTPSLCEILRAPLQLVTESGDTGGPIDAGFRDGDMREFAAFLRSPIPVNRRFALARLVGDHLTAPLEDKLLPAAQRVGTQRQQFQRAFAQELLCPHQELVRYLGTGEHTDEDVVEAARFFDVSELVVKSILVNKDEAGAERFTQQLRRQPPAG